MSIRVRGEHLIALGMLIVLLAAVLNYHSLSEAFGAGPPYYSRSTDMDKWSNPFPFLLIVDALVALVTGLVLRLGIARIRTHRK